VRLGRSRTSKVIEFCTNRKRVCDFQLVRHTCTLVLSCIVSEILQVFVLMAHPYCTVILGCSRWTRSPMLGSLWAGILSYLAVKLFSKYSNLCDHGTWTSQTDRQTIYCGITALCVASHGEMTVGSSKTVMLRPFVRNFRLYSLHRYAVIRHPGPRRLFNDPKMCDLEWHVNVIQGVLCFLCRHMRPRWQGCLV